MKILALQNQLVILTKKQLSHIKGGSDSENATEIIVIIDGDVI